MSSSANTSGSLPRLGPTWYRGNGGQAGRGFQPPPAAVPVERRSRSGSYASSDSDSKPNNVNKFSALDDDEDSPKDETSKPRTFRSASFGQRSPSGPGAPTPKGRSLADLAARVPETTIGRSHSMGYRSDVSGRFISHRNDSNVSDASVGAKIVRFTREKLLALRPRPSSDDDGPPESLKHLEGTAILSHSPLDPVCWENFDADEIWAQVARERSTGRASSLLMPKGTGGLRALAEASEERRRSAGPGTGRWQRGVALPPADESNHRGRGRQEAENPNDLWDDPLALNGAAADFSAFGSIPDDPKDKMMMDSREEPIPVVESFDFNKMAEATQEFEKELRGGSKSSLDSEGDENGTRVYSVNVDPHRPLASAGTTIRAGSGDDVNVFEDFDDEPAESVPVKAADEDPSASSRLMKMIGVTRDEPILDVNKGLVEETAPIPAPAQPEEFAQLEEPPEPDQPLPLEEPVQPEEPPQAEEPSHEPLQDTLSDPLQETLQKPLQDPLQETLQDPLQEPTSQLGDPMKPEPSMEPERPIEPEQPDKPSLNPWASAEQTIQSQETTLPKSDILPSALSAITGASSDIPSNPWGDPIIPSTRSQTQQGLGFDLAARLGVVAAEQKAREDLQRQSQEAEILRRRQEEDMQRRALQAQQEALAQKQAEEQARQLALQRQQQQAPQQGGHSQVELILMERIAAILENSWGCSDLVSVLSTLHSEDSRVIPLLGNVDALHALIARHPRRIALRQDPAFGVEMAVLLQTNSQFQQQQQEARARAQQDELRRREQQRRLQALQQGLQNGESSAPPKVIPHAPWYYSDPQKNIQGPFRAEEMRQWLEAGYFKGDLPISQQSSGPFHPLAAIFPDLSIAFKAFVSEVDDSAARAAAEEEKRRKEEEERAAAEERLRAEMEANAEKERIEREECEQQEQERIEREHREHQEQLDRERAERERLEMEAAAKAAAAGEAKANVSNLSVDQNESSVQLKMLLGLSGTPDSQAANNMHRDDHIAAPELDNQHSNSRNNITNGGRSSGMPEPNKAPKPMRSASLTQQMLPQSEPVPAKAIAPSAWGNAASSGGLRKSMSEIQQEEARASALLAMERRTTGRQPSGGWANVAASGGGSTAWSSGTIKHTPLVVGAAGSASNTKATQSRAAPSKPQVAQRQSSAPAAVQPQKQRTPAAQPKPVDEFGASMSPALENWCKEQMHKLNGSDDLTLVSFCMTLTDPMEVRQYLTAYLGSTPQVGNFATEFINRRGLGKPKQEEWESTKPKKGRKKGGAK